VIERAGFEFARRTQVEPHGGGNQNHEGDSRLGQFDKVAKPNPAVRKSDFCYRHTASRIAYTRAGSRLRTMPIARSVSSSDVPSTSAPFATCAVVIMTDFSVQTVKAPSVN